MRVESAGAFRDEQGRKPSADPALAGVSTGRAAVPAWQGRVATALLALLALSFAVQILGVFHRNINWDEFLFLSQVHGVADGERVGLLQTSFAHLFGWLTAIGGDEITRITVARGLYVVIWAGSLLLLYRLGRELLDPLGALAGVVLFALFSYSVTHAASFRIDGLVLPVLLMVALLLLKPTTGRVAAAGALSGVAVALTIKASLWAPAFTGVLAVGLWHQQSRVKPVVAGTVAAILAFAGIMLAHSWWLSAGNDPSPGLSTEALTRTGSRMLLEDGLLPRSAVLALSFLQNPVTWPLIAAGFALAVAELRRPGHRRKPLLLLLLALPMLSLAFYANAWPYAYVVLMPTACLLAGHALSRFVSGGDAIRAVAAVLCLGLVAVPMAVSGWMLRVDQQAQQKQILSIVHELFEQPVAYIDKGGMISSFPRQPIFLSRWGMKNYRDVNQPVFARFIREAEPPLLIVNTPILEVWQETGIDPQFALMGEDIEALRATYAPYWGNIYLAGRQWRDLGEAETVSFEIIIPGEYTLLSRHAANIDGRDYAPGATVSLAAGRHSLQATGNEPDLRLLWGRDTTIPAMEPSPMPIYTGL